MLKELKDIMDEYKPDESIFTNDDWKMYKLKKALSKLSEPDRIIFILYCETGSLREVGKILGVSHTTVYTHIKELKEKILSEI